MSDWVDFRAMKDRVAIEWVLERYGVKLNRIHRSYLRGRCPLPSHCSQRSAVSFCVHTQKNIWACQSVSCQQARGGKVGGTILDLVAAMEQSSIREAALRIQGWLGGGGSEIVGSACRLEGTPEGNWLQKEKAVAGDCRRNPVLPFALRVLPWHPYLEERRVQPQTARWFGVGFYSGRGLLSGRVVFPIHDERAALIAYAGRAVDGREPKYKLPAGFQKHLVLFNFHRAAAVAGTHRVIVVEGFFDCMQVHQAGYPAVVALMGTHLSDHQASLLRERFREAMLMLDGDAAGRHASGIVASRLSRDMAVTTVLVPAGRQPDQMSSEEIQRCYRAGICLPPSAPAQNPATAR